MIRDFLKRHWSWKKLIVTIGVITATGLLLLGLNSHSLFAGLVTNLVWIWED